MVREVEVNQLPTIAPTLADLPHVPIDALVPFQGELKELSEREYSKLKKSILTEGIFTPFFVWQDNGIGRIIDGHQRERVMSREGWQMDVPVIYIDAANEQEAKRKLLLVSSQYGRVTQEGWDAFTFDLDGDWLKESVHFDALPFVFGDWETADNEQGESQDAEAQTSRADELQEIWQVQTGQLWRLPSRTAGHEHRLICGDCTDRDVVAGLMGGEKAEVICTDPPYNVGKADWDVDILPLLGDAARVWAEYLDKDFGIAFWFCSTKYLPQTIDRVSPHIPYRWLFIWNPSNNMAHGVIGFQKFTPALVLGFGKVHRGDMQDLQTIPIIVQNDKSGHPTPKPLPLFSYILEKAAINGGVIADFFGGSGTTMVGCENLGKQCRMVEISPAYCSVILQRYLDAFGITPELITTPG